MRLSQKKSSAISRAHRTSSLWVSRYTPGPVILLIHVCVWSGTPITHVLTPSVPHISQHLQLLTSSLSFLVVYILRSLYCFHKVVRYCYCHGNRGPDGIDQSIPQRPWAYCEVPGEKGLMIRRQGGETIICCAISGFSYGRPGLATPRVWEGINPGEFTLLTTMCPKSRGPTCANPVEHPRIFPLQRSTPPLTTVGYILRLITQY